MPRYKIGSHIAISKTQSEKSCIICGSTICPKQTQVIIYLNHKTSKFYNWIHVECIPNLIDKLIWSGLDKKRVPIKIVESNKYHLCSYCDNNFKFKKHTDVLSFGMVYLHEDCIPKLIQDVENLVPQIIAERI